MSRLLNTRLRPIAAAVLVATTFTNITSLHAEAVLEEVIVTAQLRAEKLQDVPASIVTLSGDKMFEAGINDIADFQAYVPNLAMSETGIGTNIYVRGIGSGINQGFEQSVGMYVDGVYYGRAQLTRAPLMDLQRVEALRGPQNILLGKNSIAGAISLITAKPTNTPDSMVSASYTPETEERLYDVVLSGPLNDKAAARLAYRKLDSDGDIENLTLNRDEPRRDEDTVRAILTFDVTENFDYMLKYEHSSFNVTGRSIEIINDDPAVSRLPGITGRTWGEILSNTNLFVPAGAIQVAPNVFLPTSNASLNLNAGPSVLNNTLDHDRSSNGDTSDNTTDNATFIGNYAIDKSVLTFTTAWLSYHYDEDCDCDFTGSNIFTLASKEKYDQFSQEVRFLSPVDEEVEYITGIYYQTSDLKFNDDFVVPPGSALPSLVNYAAKFNATAVDDNSGFALANISVPRSYSQDSDLYSVFGEVTWNIQTDFRAIFGGRYSYEKKDASRELTVGANGIVPVQVTQVVLSQLFKVDTVGHDLKDDRNKGNFSPEVKVEYDINDDILTYAKATEGYKSGGYDTRSNAIPGGSNDGSFEFDDERATAYEVGMKNSLFDDELELNIAYFYTEYDDMQVSIYDGKLGFNVGNAAKAVTQGVEIESRWQATEQLSFSGSLAYLDFEYKDFQNGQCPQGVAPDDINTGYCSYDGKSNQYVAPWTAAVLGQYIQPLFDGLELKFNLDLLYSDEYNPTQNLDSRVEQDAYTKVNARIGLSGNDGQWDIALVGKNLTNEEIITYANDTPLSYNLVQSVGHYAVVEDLRTIAITATYHF